MSFYIKETKDIKEASDRMSKILDAKYSKADLHQLVRDIKILNDLDQNKLLNVLQRHESLFDRTLVALKGNIKPSKQLSDKENNAIKDIGKPRWEWPAREAQTLP